jgi:prepilin peptidase CpaA
MQPQNGYLIVCLALGLAASAEDLWRRRISNVTIVAGLALGLALQTYLRGWWAGAWSWAAGAAVGLGVFLVFFLFGGMGGGDVKLMAAFGGCLGVRQILLAALLAAIAGAGLACGFLLWRWIRRRPDTQASGQVEESIPYAPAIFAGILLSFLAGG